MWDNDVSVESFALELLQVSKDLYGFIETYCKIDLHSHELAAVKESCGFEDCVVLFLGPLGLTPPPDIDRRKKEKMGGRIILMTT